MARVRGLLRACRAGGPCGGGLRGRCLLFRLRSGGGFRGRRGGGFLLWRGGDARREDLQVAPARRPRQQHALQRDRAHDAALDVSKNNGERSGAEVARDGGEAARGGAAFERVGEMAAVCGEDGDDVEDGCDVLGHGVAVPVLGGIGSGRKAGGVGHGVHCLP